MWRQSRQDEPFGSSYQGRRPQRRSSTRSRHKVEFGIGRSNDRRHRPPRHAEPLWDLVPQGIADLKQQAANQLGTVGAGNHYVDILIDEADGAVWVAAHFGSRGLGHKTATYFLKQLGAKDEIMAAPAVVDSTHREYLAYLTPCTSPANTPTPAATS